MVVQNPERPRRPHRVFVQIREHLLTAPEASIDEQNNADGLRPKLRPVPKDLLNRRSAMLAIIDHKTSIHRNAEHTDVFLCSILASGDEANLTVN